MATRETSLERYERLEKKWKIARDRAAFLREQMMRAADAVRRENRERDEADALPAPSTKESAK